MPATTSSRLPASRPGLPRFGWSRNALTDAMRLTAIRLAATGLSRAMKSPIASRSASAGRVQRILNPSSNISRARNVVVASEVGAIGGGYSRLYLADLPGVQSDIVLDCLGREPTARAFSLLGKPIQCVERRIGES